MPKKLQDLTDYDYEKSHWDDEIIDPEGDNSKPATPFSARRANNIETGVDLAHHRLNDTTSYLEGSDRVVKILRFEFLLLKASVTSGLTTNILVDNFETANGVDLSAGMHDPELQRIYLP